MIITTLVVTEFMTNCFIVGDDATKEAIIIDPGGEGLRIIKEVEAQGLRLVGIVNTHAHVDHIGANRDLKDYFNVSIMMHQAELPVLRVASKMARLFGVNIDQPPGPDRFLDEGDKVVFGDTTLGVLHTPGHSPGGISLVSQDGKSCFVGDTLFAGSIGRTDLPGGDYNTLINSIKGKLLPLGDDVTVYPGHGPKTTIGTERKFNPFL